MAIRLTKTSKVIFAILIFVLSLALGFLIWRVNQESTVGPEEGQAGQSQNGSCWSCCLPGEFKVDKNGNKYCPGGSLCGCKVTCGDGVTISKRCSDSDKDACVNCYHAAPGNSDPVGGVECNIGSQCKNKCYWPEVSYCTGEGKCICKGGADNRCEDDSPKCSPDCPDGYTECSGGDCGTDTKNAECSAKCAGCNNLYYVKITCTKTETRPDLCDSTTISKSTLLAGESATVTSKTKSNANNFTYALYNRDNVYSGTNPKPICVAGAGYQGDCPAGSHHLILSDPSTVSRLTGQATFNANSVFISDLNWGGKKVERIQINAYFSTTGGLTSLPDPDCVEYVSLSEPVTVLTPRWDITKGVVEACIDESTANPKSELTYTITVKNIGTAAGTITKIEDVLDSKIQSSFIQTSTITSPGAYANGKITWNFSTPLSIAVDQSKVYTYKVVVDKDNFGSYANTVTLSPSVGSTINASANITADCEITPDEEPEEPEQPGEPGTVPETGIFDSTASRIVAGFVLLTFGAVIYNLPNSAFSMPQRERSYKYRDRFEKKVANR